MAEIIAGGFYIKARKIKESDVAHAAPCVREVWDWLISECNHKDSEYIKRGQCVRSIKDIQEGLHWWSGYRKETYSKQQCERALEFLRDKRMVETRKTTRGLFITVCNYDYYNNPDNYGRTNGRNNGDTRAKQQHSTINKNDNNEKNDKKEEEATPRTPEEITEFEKFENWVKQKAETVGKMKEPFTINQFFEIKEKFPAAKISEVLQNMHNWQPLLKKNKSAYLTLLKWIKKDLNGTHQQLSAAKTGTSQSRTDALKKWGASGGE